MSTLYEFQNVQKYHDEKKVLCIEKLEINKHGIIGFLVLMVVANLLF